MKEAEEPVQEPLVLLVLVVTSGLQGDVGAADPDEADDGEQSEGGCVAQQEGEQGGAKHQPGHKLAQVGADQVQLGSEELVLQHGNCLSPPDGQHSHGTPADGSEGPLPGTPFLPCWTKLHVLSQPSREHHITRKRDDIESERAVLPLMSVLSD